MGRKRQFGRDDGSRTIKGGGAPSFMTWKDADGHDSIFPAWRHEEGMLVDLRDSFRKVDAQWLRQAGLPDAVIKSAETSNPPGYAFIHWSD